MIKNRASEYASSYKVSSFYPSIKQALASSFRLLLFNLCHIIFLVTPNRLGNDRNIKALKTVMKCAMKNITQANRRL